MLMKQAIKPDDVAALLRDGQTIMIAGFMGAGTPHRLVDAIVASGRKDFTLICTDTARPGVGIGKLIDAGIVRELYASHIGLNPVTQAKMMSGEMTVHLTPQGTLAERIRAGGAGLGGVLTRTGLGTLAAEGKPTITVGGEEWVVETALRADVAFIHAQMADYYGNLSYTLTSTNFNPLMAMAADTVVCEAREIVPVGVIPPDAVRTPGILVDHLLARAA
jgi:acetate CoA/acetoacetate CoA-transferase alpha subunit